MHKLLVVDDEPQVLTAIEHLLEDEFEVISKTDPNDALDLLEEKEVSVVLSDQRMPGLSGEEFLSRAREVSDATRVLITGYTDIDALARAVNHGQIHAYLTKPWNPEGLRFALQQAAERYQLAHALRTSQTRLNNVVEALPEGVCLLDQNHNIMLVNPLGRICLNQFSNAKVGDHLTHIGELTIQEILTHKPTEMPLQATTQTPASQTFEVVGRYVTGGDTSEKWALIIMRNITQQQHMQKRMERQNRLVAVGQLAAGIAHDFNNLLTVISSAAQIVMRQPDIPSLAKERLHHIVHQGQQGAQLVRQILDFSGKTITTRNPVDLVPFLKEIEQLLKRTLSDNIQVTTYWHIDKCVVKANPMQLQQILTNLALNAQDAMPNGGQLYIGLSAQSIKTIDQKVPPGNWAILKITDTGQGIEPDTLKHIFEPFFTTKPETGTGLGLAQVYGIITQHEGEIAVESEINQGTTFTIYLPQIEQANISEPQTEKEIIKGNGETILVVEDRADVRELTQTMLEDINYRIYTAANGKEALDFYKTHADQIDLVLTDVVMPEMGGWDLLNALKSQDASLPVLIMTGYPLGKVEEMQKLQETAGYLEKPLKLSKLSQTIHQALDKS